MKAIFWDFFLPDVISHNFGRPEYFNAVRVLFSRYLDLRKHNNTPESITRAKNLLFETMSTSTDGCGYLEPIIAGLLSYHLRTYGTAPTHRSDVFNSPKRLLSPEQQALINRQHCIARARRNNLR
jgi:hypothetical protein